MKHDRALELGDSLTKRARLRPRLDLYPRRKSMLGRIAHPGDDRISGAAQCSDRDGILITGAEIPGAHRGIVAKPKSFGERQIAAQRLQHMLPGADRTRRPELEPAISEDGSHDIGHEPVF